MLSFFKSSYPQSHFNFCKGLNRVSDRKIDAFIYCFIPCDNFSISDNLIVFVCIARYYNILCIMRRYNNWGIEWKIKLKKLKQFNILNWISCNVQLAFSNKRQSYILWNQRISIFNPKIYFSYQNMNLSFMGY